MRGLPQTWGGGTDSYKVGALKRRLDAVVVARFDPSTGPDVLVNNRQLVLKGLNGDLTVNIAAAFSAPSDGQPILPSRIPAGLATMQLTPVINSPNMGKLYLRPVFQDPTALANQNHPLPQDCPFGWEFSTEADEVYIDFVINDALVVGNQASNLVVAVTVEYTGQWWSIDAIKYALSQVQLTGTGSPFLIGTNAG